MKLIHIFTGLPNYTDEYLKSKIDVAKNIINYGIEISPGYIRFGIVHDCKYVVRIHSLTCFDRVTDELIARLDTLYNALYAEESVACYYINECYNDELANELDEREYSSMTFKDLIDIMEG